MIGELEKLLFAEHYLSLMLILILICVIFGRKKLSDRMHQGNFWITILVCALLTVQDILAYRVGGDEFAVLFLRCTEDEVQQALSDFQNEMWRVALPVAIGYAVRTEENESPEELFRLSDKRMYEDKRLYYQLHDRRKVRTETRPGY